jgi:hypothetical protein
MLSKADYVVVDVGKVAKVKLEDWEQIDHRGSSSVAYPGIFFVGGGGVNKFS